MKKIKYIFSLFTIVAISSPMYGQSAQTLIVKKWKFKEFDKQSLDSILGKQFKQVEDSIAKITDSAARAKAKNQLQEEMVSAPITMTNTLKGMTFDVKINCTLEISAVLAIEGNRQLTVDWKWELSKNGKQLTTTDKGGEKHLFDVIQLSNDEIVVKNIEGDIGMGIGMVFTARK